MHSELSVLCILHSYVSVISSLQFSPPQVKQKLIFIFWPCLHAMKTAKILLLWCIFGPYQNRIASDRPVIIFLVNEIKCVTEIGSCRLLVGTNEY